MYDLHCHLLPGIDDGPEDLATAIELAKVAVANGITHSVVTPHIHLGRYDNNKAIIEAKLIEFKQALAEQNIPLTLAYAAEIRLGAEILNWVMDDSIPYLGKWQGRKVLLLELPHSHIPPGADKLIDWLIKQNIQVMIAHPERNKDVMRDIDKLSPFVEAGCLFQVTAGSTAGFFGSKAERIAQYMLEQGLVTILASDAHNIKHRPPSLIEGLSAASDIIGEHAASKLVNDNPRLISESLFDG